MQLLFWTGVDSKPIGFGSGNFDPNYFSVLGDQITIKPESIENSKIAVGAAIEQSKVDSLESDLGTINGKIDSLFQLASEHISNVATLTGIPATTFSETEHAVETVMSPGNSLPLTYKNLVVRGDVTVSLNTLLKFEDIEVDTSGSIELDGMIYCKTLENNGSITNPERIGRYVQ